MSDADKGLAPEDFATSATKAVAASAGLSAKSIASTLADAGLLGVLAPESVGGLALPLAFAAPIMTAGSSGLLAFPLLESVLAAKAVATDLPASAEAITSGTDIVTIAWSGSVTAEARRDGWALSGWVSHIPGATHAGKVLVRIGSAAALVPLGAAGLVVEGCAALDSELSGSALYLENVLIPRDHLLPAGAWGALQSDAMVLRAADILGSADTCLKLATDYASTRRQFGHTLVYNQSIRHMLARHKMGLESIRFALQRALAPASAENARAAAFLCASHTGAAICEAAIQIYGGIGFTWDIPLHHHLRRVRTLQQQGDASSLLAALGQRTVASIPPAPTTITGKPAHV